MPAALLLAIALLADPPAAAPASPAPPASGNPAETESSAAVPAARADGCSPRAPIGDAREIVVCAPRPQGYRIDPDILEANRAKRTGRPKRPERLADTSCGSVGPFGCTPGAGIDLIGGAITAAAMVAKAIRGENVGQMFVTDPQRSEYEYYVEAKRQREAEAQAAAAAKAQSVKDSKAAETPAPGSEPPPKH